MKVKKGWLAIQVGLEEEDGGIQKFVIPISYLYHPLLQKLLDKAHDVYGYHVDGPLKLPCSVDDFLHIRLGTGSEWDHRTGTNRNRTGTGRFDRVVDRYRDEPDRNYRDGGSVPSRPTIYRDRTGTDRNGPERNGMG
uniref:SAUR family protein n=1 Tax=Solanum tuberosum TaxID=4113 RepID=M1C4Y4_SOLTU